VQADFRKEFAKKLKEVIFKDLPEKDLEQFTNKMRKHFNLFSMLDEELHELLGAILLKELLVNEEARLEPDMMVLMDSLKFFRD